MKTYILENCIAQHTILNIGVGGGLKQNNYVQKI